MSERPDFSLIVGTLGRLDCLQRLFASLNRQHGVTLEVILIDQSAAGIDPTQLPKGEFILRHCRQEPGLSRCRNAGLKYAQGRIVAFPDDDCHYPDNLLPQLLAEFERAPGIDGLSVKVTDENGALSAGFMSNHPMEMTAGNIWRTAVSVSIFFRRNALTGIWFDERLGVGCATPYQSGEETDFCLQVLEAGKKLLYLPNCTVFHPIFRGPFTTARGRGYGMGMGAVLKKHHYGWPKTLLFAAYQFARALQHLCLGHGARAGFHWTMALGRLRGYYLWPR